MNKKRGFTILETIIGISVLIIVSVGILSTYSYLSSAVSISRAKIAAVAVLDDDLELLRNLNYSDVGEVGGFPSGVLSHTATTTRSGYDFFITRTIRNIDDPFDGTLGGNPNDTLPADYKFVEVQVDCISCKEIITFKQSMSVAPRNLEISNGGGALFIRTLDANGVALAGANVHVTNTLLNPTITIDDVTNNQGILQLVDIPASVSGYNIVITKNGYSTDQTYIPGAVGNPNPINPNSTITPGVVTQTTFSIDKTSTVNISTTNQVCGATPDVSLSVAGSKLIGTSPDVIKYSWSGTTNGSGLKTLSDIEWDLYKFNITDANYDLAGSIPIVPFNISPNTTQNVQLLVNPKNPRAILVNVKDSATLLPISGATVNLTKGLFSTEVITGYGSLSQSDWSLGSGQITIGDNTKYFDQDGSIEIAAPTGEIKLRDVLGSYAPSGYLTSSTYDTGTASNFSNIIWGPEDQPVETGVDSVKFQIASNNDNTTWNFVGPDNTSSTYYTLSNTNISNHNGNRYFRYRIYLTTSDTTKTPNISDISFTFTSSCVPPGQAFFNGLASGTYTLTITHPSYQTFTDTAVSMSSNYQSYDAPLSP